MDLVLADAEAHVWRASLDVDGPALEELAQTLSDDERARAERFRFDRDHRRFVAGRGVLRIILARYLARPPSSISLRYGPWGKPALALDADPPDLRFNVSHADGLVLYAIARGREIGVDVERIVPRLAAAEMIERCLTRGEGAALRALEPGKQPTAFFRCWTRKEAYLKGRGHGLAFSPRRVEVSLDENEPPALLAVAGDPAEASRWSLRDLSLGVSHVAALAVAALPRTRP
jgi:4'-phosphopantetheinyl transferase